MTILAEIMKLFGKNKKKQNLDMTDLENLVIQLRATYDPGATMTKMAAGSHTDQELLTLNELESET